MPNVYWRGDAVPVADVWTVTLTGPATGTGTVTVAFGDGTKAVSVAFSNTETAAVIAQRLADSLASSAVPEVRELPASYPGTGGVVTLTGSPGIPSTVSGVSVTPAVGVTVALAHPTVATGPNHADNPKNYSTGTLPGTNANETLVIEGGAPVLYGLDGMFDPANPVANVFWRGSVSGGLPRRNTTAGEPGYWEYRPRAVEIPGGTVTVGDDARPGPDRLNLKFTDSGTLNVWKTGTPGDDEPACVDATCAAAETLTINAYGGSCGYALTLPDGGGTVAAASCVPEATLFLTGTVTTLNQRGGTVYDRSALATLNAQGGDYWKDGGDVDVIVADSGRVHLLHTQGTTIAATFRGSVAGDPPVLDLAGNDAAPRDLANTSSFTGGAFVLDPYKTAAMTGVTFDLQSLNASDIGRRFAVTRT